MANEQLALYDVPPEPPKQCDKQKKSWEDGFQRWSNKQFGEGGSGYGACGYGSMSIDYSNRNYEDIWDGVFKDGK